MYKKVIVVLLVLLSLVGCSKKEEYIVEKKPQEVIDMFDNGESFVLFCGTPTCETCAKFRPILQQLCENYKLTVIYLDVADYESAEIKNLTYNYLYRLEWTPTVYVVKNGHSVAINENDGDTLLSYNTLLEWLEEYDAIPIISSN